MWYVYMLECNDGTLYTGVTTDLARRFEEHLAARGAKYTRARGVSKITYHETCASRSDAYRREAWIKGLTRGKKLDLISAQSGGGV